MLNRIACLIFLMVGASLVASCTAATKETGAKIDAHTLLTELEEMIKEIPDTKEECQAKLKEIRAWQEEISMELKSQPKSTKYGFEYQWKPQTYEDSMACRQVLFSSEHADEGDCSLKMMMDLVPGDKGKSKGEALVDMRDYPPLGEHIPVNLRGKTVSAHIYAPWGARGTPDKPNGFQVFVKDTNDNSEYGPWHNVREAEWFDISLRVSPDARKGGSMDTGFDPSQIVVVGVKMGAGGGSKKPYNDPVFIDGISW